MRVGFSDVEKDAMRILTRKKAQIVCPAGRLRLFQQRLGRDRKGGSNP